MSTSTDTPPATRRPRRTGVRVAAATLGLVSLGAAGASIASAADRDRRPRTVEVDIAEDGTRFVFDEAPVFDDGMPAHGNPFVTQGYVYPAGTLTETTGVNPDGTPEFPDRVIPVL